MFLHLDFGGNCHQKHIIIFSFYVQFLVSLQGFCTKYGDYSNLYYFYFLHVHLHWGPPIPTLHSTPSLRILCVWWEPVIKIIFDVSMPCNIFYIATDCYRHHTSLWTGERGGLELRITIFCANILLCFGGVFTLLFAQLKTSYSNNALTTSSTFWKQASLLCCHATFSSKLLHGFSSMMNMQ